MNNQNDTDKTERAELLSKLKSITFAAFMTVLTEEMSLEIETMNSEGTSYQWLGYDEWNVYSLKTGDRKQWSEILKKLSNRQLKVKDLGETDLYMLVTTIDEDVEEDSDCSLLLEGLLCVSEEITESFYCYYDCRSEDRPRFFSSQKGLKAVLKDAFPASILWDEMETADLRRWWERYEAEGAYMPVISFNGE